MTPCQYAFRPLAADDLPLVRRWLGEAHVAQWWGDAEAQLALVRDDLEQPAMRQFIVATAARPFGYIQCYDPALWPELPFGPQTPGTRGINQFIGEPDMVGRGHGSAFIRTFVDRLLSAGTPRVLTDPDPANGRAIRAYQKAGFRRDCLITTSEGPALVMVRTS